MNYETFLQAVCEEVNGALSPDESVVLQSFLRVNDTTHYALVYHAEGSSACPIIYLEDYYKDYQNAADSTTALRDITASILHTLQQYKSPTNIQEQLFPFDAVKDRICFRLIQEKTNQSLLKELPHLIYLDFAIIFYVPLEIDGKEEATTLIRHPLLSLWNISPETLFQHAIYNTPLRYPPKAESLNHLVAKLVAPDNAAKPCDPTALQSLLTQLCSNTAPVLPTPSDIPLPEGFLVLSNSTKYFGASVLYYPDLLKRFSLYFNTDFFIIPSSIHEVLLLPDNGTFSLQELSNMVQSINADQVLPEERLSDHAYFFDKKSGILTY